MSLDKWWIWYNYERLVS